jgi:hypothetical protein
MNRRHVSCWHLADMTTVFADVRFRGSSGHLKVRRQCPLMTDVVEKVGHERVEALYWAFADQF